MAANYEIWITDDYGRRLQAITTFLTVNASRSINKIGSCNITVPLSFDEDLLKIDNMIQIWREPPGGTMSLWRVYFIRKRRFTTQENESIISFGGPDINDLLRRRIVAAYTESSQAKKSSWADSIMRDVVKEAMLDTADPTPQFGSRGWNNLYFQSLGGQGPIISRSFPFKQLLTPSGQGILPNLSKASEEAGNQVFFDIVPKTITSNSIDFIFTMYLNQPGLDVSSKVTFDQADGNMRNPDLFEDYSEEENVIYAGGQGQEDDRNVQQVADKTRYGISQWNRCEGFADARSQEDNEVRETAREKLNEGRPKIVFSATPVDTEKTRFGVDWDFGYRVSAKYNNRQFKALISTVTLSLQPGREDIQSRLDYEGFI